MNFFTISIAMLFIWLNRQYTLADEAQSVTEAHERNKRFVFLQGSGIGYLVALAIPTSSVFRQRVYMAFNFEAHYGLASAQTFLSKFNSSIIGDTVDDRKRREIRSERMSHFSDENNAYTRKNFYRFVEKHIKAYGYNGTSCLQRIICETSETPLYGYNGLFGNVFHILFTPSSSKGEKIKPIYYEAEYNGQMGECQRYHAACNISFLDLVSQMINLNVEEII